MKAFLVIDALFLLLLAFFMTVDWIVSKGMAEPKPEPSWDPLDEQLTDAELLMLFDTQAPSDSKLLRFSVGQPTVDAATGIEIRH